MDVGQDGLFILYFNEMSELKLPSLTGAKNCNESSFREVDEDSMFILYGQTQCRS